MQDAIKRQMESVTQHRKHLAEVESRLGQYQKNVPLEIWQELAEISRQLKQAEQELRQTCQELAGDVNQTRAEIVSTLEQYNHWREQMHQVEDQFLVNILRPGHHLKQSIRQREYLEQEYQRIHTSIQREDYSSQQELEADIRRVLTHGDTAFDAQVESTDEELLQDEGPFDRLDETNVDDLMDDIPMDELVKEFKRVVLPAVHPDTSDTPDEVFETVFEVYKKGDPLLMEAYIIEYRGEYQTDRDADPLGSLDQVLKTQERYQRVSVHLQRRVDRIKQNLTTQEIEDPVKLQENMQQQRQEILTRIQSEAEQILYWRAKIEGLVQDYRERHKQAGEG